LFGVSGEAGEALQPEALQPSGDGQQLDRLLFNFRFRRPAGRPPGSAHAGLFSSPYILYLPFVVLHKAATKCRRLDEQHVEVEALSLASLIVVSSRQRLHRATDDAPTQILLTALSAHHTVSSLTFLLVR
jgi:hypothetical protein